MDLTLARAIADAVLTRAAALEVSISCCVVDRLGHEVLTLRMAGAPFFTPHVARTKARTAVALRMDSADVAALAQAYPDLIPVIDEQLPFTLTTLGGGVVVTDDADVLGAVAVSGATPEQDAECARAGVQVWLAERP